VGSYDTSVLWIDEYKLAFGDCSGSYFPLKAPWTVFLRASFARCALEAILPVFPVLLVCLKAENNLCGVERKILWKLLRNIFYLNHNLDKKQRKINTVQQKH